MRHPLRAFLTLPRRDHPLRAPGEILLRGEAGRQRLKRGVWYLEIQMRLFSIPAMIAAAALLVPVGFAQEAKDETKGGHKEEQKEKEAEEWHRHHIGILMAGSHNTERNGFTPGVDYEFKFVWKFGVMATYEHVGGGFREDLFAFTAAVHPWKGLKIQAGPGFEREVADHEVAPHEGEAGESGGRRALLRLGAGYDWEVGKYMTIGPDFAFDFLHGEKVFVYGLTIGFGFGPRK